MKDVEMRGGVGAVGGGKSVLTCQFAGYLFD